MSTLWTGTVIRPAVSAFSGIRSYADAVHSLVWKCPTKSSVLDPLPTSLVKANTDILAPILATIINMLFESGLVPANFKHAVITLKKSNLDPDEKLPANVKLINYVNVLERHVALQLHQHLENSSILGNFISAYYLQYHSIETALVRIKNEFLRSVDRKKGVHVVLLHI